MKLIAGLVLAVTSLTGLPAFAAELGCASYAAFHKLPASFKETASGTLPNYEVVWLSNGVCTCDNGPSIARRFGRPVPADANWSCRVANDDERGGNR